MRPKQVLILAAAILAQRTCFADGGAVQLRRETKDLVITVFSSPAPLSVGLQDISILLQRRAGLEPVTDAEVSMLLRAERSKTEMEAQFSVPGSKSLYAAPITFTEPGAWNVIITVLWKGERTETTARVDVAPAQVLAAPHWKYVAAPPVIIVLFLVREQLVRRKRRG